MLYFVKQSRRLVYIANFLIVNNKRFLNTIRPYSCFLNYTSQNRLCSAVQRKGFLVSYDQFGLVLSRNKYDSGKKKKGKVYDDESSDEEDEEELEDDDDDDDERPVEKGAELKKCRVKSLRVDAVLKMGLGTSRKSIEKAFYQNKIRINGDLIHKKSQNARLNDEIDLIKGAAADSFNSIIVGRVKILKAEPDPDTGYLHIKLWRHKSLRIDNYSDRNAWREPTVEE